MMVGQHLLVYVGHGIYKVEEDPVIMHVRPRLLLV